MGHFPQNNYSNDFKPKLLPGDNLENAFIPTTSDGIDKSFSPFQKSLLNQTNTNSSSTQQSNNLNELSYDNPTRYKELGRSSFKLFKNGTKPSPFDKSSSKIESGLKNNIHDHQTNSNISPASDDDTLPSIKFSSVFPPFTSELDWVQFQKSLDHETANICLSELDNIRSERMKQGLQLFKDTQDDDVVIKNQQNPQLTKDSSALMPSGIANKPSMMNHMASSNAQNAQATINQPLQDASYENQDRSQSKKRQQNYQKSRDGLDSPPPGSTDKLLNFNHQNPFQSKQSTGIQAMDARWFLPTPTIIESQSAKTMFSRPTLETKPNENINSRISRIPSFIIPRVNFSNEAIGFLKAQHQMKELQLRFNFDEKTLVRDLPPDAQTLLAELKNSLENIKKQQDDLDITIERNRHNFDSSDSKEDTSLLGKINFTKNELSKLSKDIKTNSKEISNLKVEVKKSDSLIEIPAGLLSRFHYDSNKPKFGGRINLSTLLANSKSSFIATPKELSSINRLDQEHFLKGTQYFNDRTDELVAKGRVLFKNILTTASEFDDSNGPDFLSFLEQSYYEDFDSGLKSLDSEIAQLHERAKSVTSKIPNHSLAKYCIEKDINPFELPKEADSNDDSQSILEIAMNNTLDIFKP